jgi:hypothetical protein
MYQVHVVTILVFYYGGRNEEIRWLGLEPMHIAAKLIVFLGLSLYEKPFFSGYTVWERGRSRRAVGYVWTGDKHTGLKELPDNPH